MISIASRNRLRFASLLRPIFEDFGGPNGPQNSIFKPLFSMLFRNAFSYRILIDFWRLRTAKIAILLKENNDFCKIGVFDKGKKQIGFGVPFGRPNQRKFDRKSFPKNIVFLHRFLCIFYSILAPFSVPKIIEKSQFFEKMVVRRRPLKHYCFRAAFWKDFDALGARFWLIFWPPETVFKHFATYTGIISS